MSRNLLLQVTLSCVVWVPYLTLQKKGYLHMITDIRLIALLQDFIRGQTLGERATLLLAELITYGDIPNLTPNNRDWLLRQLDTQLANLKEQGRINGLKTVAAKRRAAKERPPIFITAKFTSNCYRCALTLTGGESEVWVIDSKAYCETCGLTAYPEAITAPTYQKRQASKTLPNAPENRTDPTPHPISKNASQRNLIEPKTTIEPAPPETKPFLKNGLN